MARRSADLLLGALAAYLVFLMVFRFWAFPGLHGDEAWVGRFALRIRDMGLYTPHEMNTYTGALYGWLLFKLFGLFKPDAFFLRVMGVALNAAAAVILAWQFRRRFGAASAFAWFYLLSTSAFFVFKSRVAWEVYALQDFLLALILVLCRGFAEEGDFALWRVLAFMALNYVGVFNHVIFLSVSVSLYVLLSAERALLGERESPEFWRLSIINLVLDSALYLIKSRLDDQVWRAHKAGLLALFLLLPVTAAASFRLGRWSVPRESRRPQPLYKAALVLGLVAFFAVHLKSLVQIWSGVAILQRLASWTPPLHLRWALYVWAAMLLGAFFFFALRSVEPERLGRLSRYERLLVLWPLAYAATFILFRNTSSIRYYILPSFLIMSAMACILPRLWSKLPLLSGSVCTAAALALNACFWRELVTPHERKPIDFRVGWHMERSRDFLRKEPLYELMDRERICSFPEHNSFIDQALIFYRQGHPIECDPSKSMTTSFCSDCDRPPFIAWNIGPYRPDQD